MYLIGFLVGRVLAQRLSRSGYLKLAINLIDDFLIWLFIGMLIGARLIYMLVYYEPVPGETTQWYTPFAVWEGGLAFHGAVLGMFLACVLFGRWQKVPFWNLTDTLALAGSQGIIWGRLGNFINSELVGRETSSFMGMQFPVRDFDGNIMGYTSHRHPSQLYQAMGEGLLPFILIWILKPYIKFQGVLGGIWLCLYAVARFAIEFFREKDAQMDYYWGMTMGQLLCAIMFLAGLAVIFWNRHRAIPVPAEQKAVTKSDDAEAAAG